MGFEKIWGFCLFSASVVVCLVISQDYPIYDKDDLPRTRFSCKNKEQGGYYADIETDCQMYHVCYKSKDGKMKDQKFLCGNGTVFDQRHLVCQDYHRVRNCQDSRKHYRNVASIFKEPRTVRMRNVETVTEVAYVDEDYPRYSSDDLPSTRFSCKNKVQGGYYADIETDCQMYHICARNKDGKMRSNKFLCGNGTVFDQRHLVCQDYKRVRCRDSRKYYRNVATILEELEARLMKEGRDRDIAKEADFDSERF